MVLFELECIKKIVNVKLRWGIIGATSVLIRLVYIYLNVTNMLLYAIYQK